jgi:hypothetical protein
MRIGAASLWGAAAVLLAALGYWTLAAPVEAALVWIALLILVAVPALYVVRGRLSGPSASWQRCAHDLGLAFDAEQERISGTLHGLAVTAALTEGIEGRTWTRITVEDRGSIPSDLMFRGREPATLDRSVATGDSPFDAEVTVQGEEGAVLACLDAPTRACIRRVVGLGAELRDGRLLLETPGDMRGRGQLRQSLQDMAHVGAALAENRERVSERLSHNARTDPVPAVRLRSLTVLQRRDPGDFVPREASRAALSDADPAVRLAAASFLGDEGMTALAEMVENGRVDGGLRVEAFVRLVGRLPTSDALGWLERMAALLEGVDRAAARRLVEAVARPEDARAETVLLNVLAGAARPLRVAAAGLLGRVGSTLAVRPLLAYAEIEPGEPELRDAARRAVAGIRARLGAAEAGHVSLAIHADAAGGLSSADQPGGLSLTAPAPAGIEAQSTDGLIPAVQEARVRRSESHRGGAAT